MVPTAFAPFSDGPTPNGEATNQPSDRLTDRPTNQISGPTNLTTQPTKHNNQSMNQLATW
jgi:hypothetical protein